MDGDDGLIADVEVSRGSSGGGFRVRAAFALARGELVALSGPSGSGKSTVIRTLAGLEPGARGMIGFCGVPWMEADGGFLSPWKRDAATCLQGAPPLSRMSASAQLRYAGADRRLAARLIEEFELDGFEGRLPRKLSGGQAQRLALARTVARAVSVAAAGRPVLLLLDEALAGQDDARKARLIARIAERCASGGFTGLFSGHEGDGLAALCSRTISLDAGSILRGVHEPLHARDEARVGEAEAPVEREGGMVVPVGDELEAFRSARLSPGLEFGDEGPPDPPPAPRFRDDHVLEEDGPGALGRGRDELPGDHADDPSRGFRDEDDRSIRRAEDEVEAGGLLRGVDPEIRFAREEVGDEGEEDGNVRLRSAPHAETCFDAVAVGHGGLSFPEDDGERILPEAEGKSIALVDTTLRDGEQRAGKALSASAKLELAWALEDAGIDEIEAGIPAMGGDEARLGTILRDGGVTVPCIGWCRASAGDVVAAAAAGYRWVHAAVPASDLMIAKKLRSSRAAALASAVDCVKAARDAGRGVSIGAEDASRADPGFLVELFGAVAEAGARRARYADTVGILAPDEAARSVARLASSVPIPIEFHGHDDFSLAVANSLAASDAGAAAIDVTLLGIGERAGNAAAEVVAAALVVLKGRRIGLRLPALPRLCALAASRFGTTIPEGHPIVGRSAFRHESGIHVDGLIKDGRLYSPFDPALVGRAHEIVPGRHSGRRSIAWLAREAGRVLGDEEIEIVRSEIAERWGEGAPEDPMREFVGILARLRDR